MQQAESCTQQWKLSDRSNTISLWCFSPISLFSPNVYSPARCCHELIRCCSRCGQEWFLTQRLMWRDLWTGQPGRWCCWPSCRFLCFFAFGRILRLPSWPCLSRCSGIVLGTLRRSTRHANLKLANSALSLVCVISELCLSAFMLMRIECSFWWFCRLYHLRLKNALTISVTSQNLWCVK